MSKLLLFSHSGFSDSDANGITMKNLLSAWPAEDMAEFYCDVQPPDYSAAHRYFRVTDVDMIKAFLGKSGRRIFQWEPGMEVRETKTSGSAGKPSRKIPAWLKKYKYNFVLKWLREYLRMISPWGHRKLRDWIREFDPDVLVYMVGESIFLDKLVLRVCKETGKPLVLYNGEAFRIIDLNTRRGLERAYYRKTKKLYEKLNETASLVIYNCQMLKEDYEAVYSQCAKAIVEYNSADCNQQPYVPGDSMNITYFGNLGVGRSAVLLQVADILERIDPALVLDIYGNATEEFAQKFRDRDNIRYHGFINAEQLSLVIGKSDILLHVESFDETIVPKLKYAFSTKIAQCLCSGRCFISFAPSQTASTQYLLESGGAKVASTEEEMETLLRKMVTDPEYRLDCARKGQAVGLESHRRETVARRVKEEIGVL